MTDPQKDALAGVLLSAACLGLLLGAWAFYAVFVQPTGVPVVVPPLP